MQRPLERSSIEAYGGIVIGIVVAIFPAIPLWAKGILLAIAVCLVIDAVYRAPLTININRWWKRCITVTVLALGAWAFWFIEPPISYVYVAPGVWLADGRWDFLINHRGPEPVNQVEILFQDQDRLDHIRRTQNVVNPSDYMVLLDFPEIDPEGRGSIFAKQFQWTPFAPDRSHFTTDITSRTMDYGEDIYTARVSGKWYFAISTRKRDNHKIIFQCRDAGFPSGQPDITGKPCFPHWITESK